MLNLYILLFVISDVLYVTNAQVEPQNNIGTIQFIVYSKDSKYNLSDETVKYIDPKLTTILVVHGFLFGTSSDMYITNITTAYQEIGYNSILVDWSGYEFALNYFVLVLRGITEIGSAVGEKILFLQSHGVDLKRLELVGASIGAHIAGYAGRYITERENTTIHRIAGLDPAGVFLDRVFGIFGNPNALRATDADVVDVTHTDGQFLGTPDNIGSIDIYVNGGLSQAACTEAPESMNPLGGVIITTTCSHLFAVTLYHLTIGNSDYRASTNPYICENLVVYGDQFMGNTTGIYFLRTEDEYPYKSLC